MVHCRGAGGHVHLLVVGRRIGSELAFHAKVAGQTPDFLLRALHAYAAKDEKPVVVVAVAVADVRLPAIG
jgi:hypothetical protein